MRDKCVRCGKCLAECPYYLQTHSELFSPRGRILMAEEFENAESVNCFACMNCADTCPFDLTPLEYEKHPFKFPDVMIPETIVSVKNLFDLIYNFSEKADCIRNKFKNKTVNNRLAACWFEKRGIPVQVDFKLDFDNMLFRNGTLMNPFLDEKVWIHAGGPFEERVFWNKLLERRL